MVIRVRNLPSVRSKGIIIWLKVPCMDKKEGRGVNTYVFFRILRSFLRNFFLFSFIVIVRAFFHNFPRFFGLHNFLSLCCEQTRRE